ncbi:peptide ABC transporter substrate-binding protein [Parasporobacterium paucivorans]|uniref:Oligopeptide transport system substrate-binding protein n=1 Tax=Parasporobacterium paucivorans DSM 15970 TaxID=1122934 RepID=A0A1M6J8A0_9FIRM|nr:peptide ABC transporter substrate-binding protein [Parasporobacterium paucivorans]SHJ42916.1 oligopeptide transport system substrate-binding protein [Parasporobacterium paucivorans DSM 15970]
MKRILTLILSLTMVTGLTFSLAGCGSSNADETTTGAAVKYADSMTVALASQPDTIDPALNSSVDGATYIIHAFAGLVGYQQNEDGTLKLVADCAKELPKAETLEDGSVQYVFELKDDLKWSDGSALTAQDFVYAWNRAVDPATAADYGYMFEVVDGYADVTATDDAGVRTNPDAVLNVTASEDGKTLTVVLPVDVPYFFELCAFPTYMPVKQDVVQGNEAWATAAETYIGNGPYKITEFSNSQIIMQKNENYWNADAIKTNEIVFAFNSDDTSLLANYQNGSYQFIDSVPTDEIASLKEQYPDEFAVEGQLGTYYISFNVNDNALSDFTEEEKADIRKALSLLIDRNYIVEEIGQAGQVAASGFVAMGLTEPDGSEYIANNGPKMDGAGYFEVKPEDYTANSEAALELLRGVAETSGLFTVDADGVLSGFPTLAYITNPGSGHEAIAAYLNGLYAQYGINMTVATQEWSTFLQTRKNGEYSVARNGWLADYNDSISFLDMWTTASGNNDSQLGKGPHASYAGYSLDGKDGLTWAKTYDVLIAKVKSSKDQEERFKLMHEAEDLLMSTGAICPLYYYTDIYMKSKSMDGFFASPLGYKYFMYATVAE